MNNSEFRVLFERTCTNALDNIFENAIEFRAGENTAVCVKSSGELDYLKATPLRLVAEDLLAEFSAGAVSEEDAKTPFAEGMNMVYKQLMGELEKLDVKPIEAVGKEFDPNLHNAVMQVESEEFESGIVALELQKGYTYRDQVVRHSMVAVVQ